MNHVFISYSHDDSDKCRDVIEIVEKAGFECWRDVDRMRGGRRCAPRSNRQSMTHWQLSLFSVDQHRTGSAGRCATTGPSP